METQPGSQIALETFTGGSPPFLAHQFFPGSRARENIVSGKPAMFPSRGFLDPGPTDHNSGPLERGQYSGHGMEWDVKTWDWDSVLFLAQPSSSAAATTERPKGLHQGAQNGNRDEYHATTSNGIGLRLDGSSTSPDRNGSSEPDDRLRRKFSVCDQENGHPSYSDRAQPFLRDGSSPEEDGESLSLKLGGHSYAYSDDAGNGSRNAKRYRSSSPGPQFPMCQVDDCKADLSHAKDYHRRHKVCEMHSKAGMALVSRLMQRFCQQCSRFHPLTEFDEDKRSCRRRLAGHNRRRRKNQPDTPTGRGCTGAEQDGTGNAMGLVGFLNILSSLQAVSTVGTLNGIVNERDALLQYLKKGVLSPPSGLENLNTAAVANLLNLSGGVSGIGRQDLKPQSSPSNGHAHNAVAETEALLSALAVPKTTEALSLLLQSSLRGQLTSAILKAAETPLVHIGQNNGNSSLPVVSPTARIPDKEVVEHANTGPVLSLSSPMAVRPMGPHNLASSSRHNITHEQVIAENFSHQADQLRASDMLHGQGTPFGVVHKLFPPSQALERRGIGNGKFNVNNAEDEGATESTSDLEAPGSMMTSLEGQDARTLQDVVSHHSRPSIDLHQPPPQYAMNEGSPSGSDQSPSSSYADWQDRTGRISIKLFDRNPGELPQLLRSQILDWLAHRPSDMESYIRPGCTMLTIFLSMPELAWKELVGDSQIRLQNLISSDEFWSYGRIHVQVDHQNAVIVDGKIHISEVSNPTNAPQLLSVRPVAVVAGQRTKIAVRGCNLSGFKTRIFCAYQGKYTTGGISLVEAGRRSLTNSVEKDIGHDEFCINFDGGCPNVVGRAFIEVERHVGGGSAVPLIVADAPVCAELQMLENELDTEHSGNGKEVNSSGLQPGEIPHQIDVKKFLNELGWLFQRSQIIPGVAGLPKFSSFRQRQLLTFAVERDWCAVVSKLLDILCKLVLASPDRILSGHSEIFGDEISLLHIAVRRRCRPMVQLLLAYVPCFGDGDANLKELLKDIFRHGSGQGGAIFTPDMGGPEGLTPLHIAASMEGAEDIVDALTDDPHQIGIDAWSNVRNSKGESPLDFALDKGRTSYVQLVRRKIDKRDGSVTISIVPEGKISQTADITSMTDQTTPSCSLELPVWSKNSSIENITRAGRSMVYISCRRLPSSFRGFRGQLYRPFLMSMVAIAAVCVVACVVMKSPPTVRCVRTPFSWGALKYGAS